MGRPWKYDILIDNLEDHVLYTTRGVVLKGKEEGFFDNSIDYPDRPLSEFEKRMAMKRASSSLAHFVSGLPRKPDGLIPVRNNVRSLHPAWYGRTWKAVLAQRKGG